MTEEQTKYIVDNFNNMSVTTLRKAFNEKFGTHYKTTAFHYHTDKLGLKKMTMHKYTKKEDDFLRLNASYMTRKQLTKLFNKTFNCHVDDQAIAVRCWKKGFIAMSNGQFKIGSVPWEKTNGGREEYVKKLKGGNSTSFTKGHTPFNSLHIGTESNRGGEIFVKTRTGWKSKRRFVWEQENGNIPKGLKIISVDGDRNNTEIDNLRIVDNNVMTVLISNKWNDKGAEIVDTGIRYAKLYGLLKDNIGETAE